MDFIPMDNDVLSMEIPDFFRDYFLVQYINSLSTFEKQTWSKKQHVNSPKMLQMTHVLFATGR